MSEAALSPILYIYTGNHAKLDGIEDYLTLFKDALGRRGFDVRVTPTPEPDAVNIIIDEFTNCLENHRLQQIKKQHPRTRYVFVLTEFIERCWGVESFNHFQGLINSACIGVFNLYLRLARRDFPRAKAWDYLYAVPAAVVVLLWQMPSILRYLVRRALGRGGPHPLSAVLRRQHRSFYFHMRYLGLLSCIGHADAIIASHECIRPDPRIGRDRTTRAFLGVIYPELDGERVQKDLMAGKSPFIELTGSVTRYRAKWIQRINWSILTLGMHHVFGLCKAFSFDTARTPLGERGAFSLHPPQTRRWPYSSPTRIYRALAVDHNLPVLTRHFGQSPIEAVCFEMKGMESILELNELYVNRNKRDAFIAARLGVYNDIVRARNDQLAEGLRKLAAQ